MDLRLQKRAALFATVLIASLGCLQPGIDPVFLTLLSSAQPVDPTDHGWIVGVTQTGMAIGSLIVWRIGGGLPSGIFVLCALVTLLASLITARIDQTAALLAVRAGYGFGMGMVYTRAMSAAATWRPNGAYGAVFFIQLLLSTLVALLLPAIADATTPSGALMTLAAIPILALGLILFVAMSERSSVPIAPAALIEQRHPISASAWAIATASLLFISATMMVWSFTGALAIAGHISEAVIGNAVAIGSLAGAVTALAVMREKALIPLPITGLLAGLSLIAPIWAAASGKQELFIAAIVLLNVGSTAIIIRCSGVASARSRDPLFRRFVACTHSGGMILGPVVGSILTAVFGEAGLLGGAIVAISAGSVALLLAALWDSSSVADHQIVAPVSPAESAA